MVRLIPTVEVVHEACSPQVEFSFHIFWIICEQVTVFAKDSKWRVYPSNAYFLGIRHT